MKEYEIHVSASYTTSGGSKEWNAFTEYVNANTKFYGSTCRCFFAF